MCCFKEVKGEGNARCHKCSLSDLYATAPLKSSNLIGLLDCVRWFIWYVLYLEITAKSFQKIGARTAGGTRFNWRRCWVGPNREAVWIQYEELEEHRRCVSSTLAIASAEITQRVIPYDILSFFIPSFCCGLPSKLFHFSATKSMPFPQF